jgi:hypothetical protein
MSSATGRSSSRLRRSAEPAAVEQARELIVVGLAAELGDHVDRDRDHQADRRDDRHHRLGELDGGPIDRLLETHIGIEAADEGEDDERPDDEVRGRERRDPEKQAVDQVRLGDRPQRVHDHQRDRARAGADRIDARGDVGIAEQEPDEDGERDRRDDAHRAPGDGQVVAFDDRGREEHAGREEPGVGGQALQLHRQDGRNILDQEGEGGGEIGARGIGDITLAAVQPHQEECGGEQQADARIEQRDEKLSLQMLPAFSPRPQGSAAWIRISDI